MRDRTNVAIGFRADMLAEHIEGLVGEVVQLHTEQELDIGKVVDRPKVQEPSELLSVHHNKVSVCQISKKTRRFGNGYVLVAWSILKNKKY